MPRHTPSRRRLLTTSAAALTALTGCVAGTSGSRSPTAGTPAGGSSTPDGSLSIAALTVADFIHYPLSGTHPHVHRQAETQYVIVRAETPLAVDVVRDRLTLELNGSSMPSAERQPVPWTHDTVDLAFAIPKDAAFDRGRILFDGTVIRSLSAAMIERLNTPPVFVVSDLSVSSQQIDAGERTTATIRFELANTGDGRGTFGASLTGNFISGAKTVTATLDADTTRTVTASIEVIGRGDAAIVWLDWGVDRWSADITVVGTPIGSETPTVAPAV